MKKNYFITIEGVEGAGKSTAINFIKDDLQSNNVDFILTREPGGTEIAEEIRKIILQHYSEPMCPYTELLLYFAGRAQHVKQVIKPALQANKWVISDRFTDASFAYQGIGRGIAAEHIQTLAEWTQDDIWPDITLVLDIDPQIGLTRTKICRELDRIESESLDFFVKVRNYYLNKIVQQPNRYKLIDASQSVTEVEQQIKKIFNKIR